MSPCAAPSFPRWATYGGRRVDVGVDGEIELVDNGTALGRALWVQSKAQSDSNPFPGEDDRGFAYTCRKVDIDYWLGSTAPAACVLTSGVGIGVVQALSVLVR